MTADTDTLTIPSENAGRETASSLEAHPPPSEAPAGALSGGLAEAQRGSGQRSVWRYC